MGGNCHLMRCFVPNQHILIVKFPIIDAPCELARITFLGLPAQHPKCLVTHCYLKRFKDWSSRLNFGLFR